jgi:hypothetical protein
MAASFHELGTSLRPVEPCSPWDRAFFRCLYRRLKSIDAVTPACPKKKAARDEPPCVVASAMGRAQRSVIHPTLDNRFLFPLALLLCGQFPLDHLPHLRHDLFAFFWCHLFQILFSDADPREYRLLELLSRRSRDVLGQLVKQRLEGRLIRCLFCAEPAARPATFAEFEICIISIPPKVFCTGA